MHPFKLFTIPLLASALSLSAVTHVIDNGSSSASDQNPGTEASPLLSIQAGADRAQPGDTVLVRAGIYRETVTMPRGGTAENKRIVYRAAPGEVVSVRGSQPVTGWASQGSGIWTVEIPNSLFGNYNPFGRKISGSWLDSGTNHTLGDVYLDGEALRENFTKKAVRNRTNSFYATVNGGTTRLYVNFGRADLSDALVEVNVREKNFWPDTTHLKYLTIEGFDIRHSATNWSCPDSAQRGGVTTRFGYGWVIQNCSFVNHRNAALCLGAIRAYPIADSFLPPISTFGHHLIRNNVFRRNGQGGIIGAYGGVRCVIEGNDISESNYRNEWSGQEGAGIKLHFAVDVVIRNNRIVSSNVRRTRGLWLDWGAQNARVTGNLIVSGNKPGMEGLKLEVNAGPVTVDNNVLCNSRFDIHGDAEAVVHNLFYRTAFKVVPDNRVVVIYQPHTLTITGWDSVALRHQRWFNNLFVGKGLDNAIRPRGGFVVNNNVYAGGAKKFAGQDAQSVVDMNKALAVFANTADSARVMVPLGGVGFSVTYPWITSAKIGAAPMTGMNIEHPDGTPLNITNDYFGNAIDTAKVVPGPFQALAAGSNLFVLWPRAGASTPVRLDRRAGTPRVSDVVMAVTAKSGMITVRLRAVDDRPVALSVMDLQGRVIDRRVVSAGRGHTTVDMQTRSSGVVLVTMRVDGTSLVRRVVVR